MLYLIGVNHSVQHDGRAVHHGQEIERLREGFAEFIVRTAQQTHAKVIAEENNQEVLEKFAATKSVAFTVAAELGIRHLFCEPSIAERKRLGISLTGSPADYEKREKYWLEKLRPIVEVPILFILGADHIASFSELAKSSGLPVSVAVEYYGRKHFAF